MAEDVIVLPCRRVSLQGGDWRVETGRAQPSQEMVMRLAEALEIPLRERNTLQMAAGYAARYRQTSLDAPSR